MQLRVQDTPLQNQHQVTINHTGQVRHTTEVLAAQVLREVTEHLPLLQSQVIVQVLLREVAATKVAEVAAEAVALRTQEVQVVQEVQVAQAAEVVVVVPDHLLEEDNH